MPELNVPKPVFISYAHNDNEGTDPAKRWLDRLKEHLEPLIQQDNITVCSDQDIGLGDDWHGHIQANLNGARAAVLLVSPAFLASKYIRNNELPVLLRNAKASGVKIFPVILRPCLFEETKFKYPDPKSGPEEFTLASLQAAGSPTKAMSEMSEGEQDRALLKVAQALTKLLSAKPDSTVLTTAVKPLAGPARPNDAVQAERAGAGSIEAPPGTYTQRSRPALGGDSIGHDRGGRATLGCLTLDRADRRKVYILSDFLGVIPRHAKPNSGDAILQPGRADGGTRPTDIIAILERWSRVRDDPAYAAHNVCAAIAQVRDIGFPGGPVMEVMDGPRAGAQASVRRMDMGPAKRKNDRISCTPGDPEWL